MALTTILLTASILMGLANAQTQCPAGIPNVQLNRDSPAQLYAVITGVDLPSSGLINTGDNSTSSASAIGCATVCDTIPGCVAALVIPDTSVGVRLPADQIPVCQFFDDEAVFTQDASSAYQGAISCEYLSEDPSAYPGLPTTNAASSVTPARAASASASASASRAPAGPTCAAVTKTVTISGTQPTGSGTYTGPKSNKASAVAVGIWGMVGVITVSLLL